MGKISSKLDSIFSAITFAEAGDHDFARELMNEKRNILLAVKESEVERKTLTYAINTCKRVKATLDILYVSEGTKTDSVVENFFDELKTEGISYNFIRSGGTLKQAVLDYTKHNSDVLCVIMESPEEAVVDHKRKEKGMSETWKNISCPLVLVKAGIIQK
ncbi:MAG: universal stress protein [Nitrospirae bacterium]|nr:universal stress protein [Nitrospirota bacterium]